MLKFYWRNAEVLILFTPLKTNCKMLYESTPLFCINGKGKLTLWWGKLFICRLKIKFLFFVTHVGNSRRQFQCDFWHFWASPLRRGAKGHNSLGDVFTLEFSPYIKWEGNIVIFTRFSDIPPSQLYKKINPVTLTTFHFKYFLTLSLLQTFPFPLPEKTSKRGK